MFNSLSEAIENLKQQGYTMVEILKNGSLKIDNKTFKSDHDLSIIDSYNFGMSSDPSEEVTLYTLSTPGKVKGYLVIGFGEHLDSDHANIVNDLLRKRSSLE